MEQANAKGVRGAWEDSFSRQRQYPASSHSHSSPLLALRGHVRQFSAPIWARFLKSEIFLRRSIPVLIVFLLILVAVARTASLIGSAKVLENNAKSQITLLADAVQLRLLSLPDLGNGIASPSLGDVFLKEALGPVQLLNGQIALLAAQDGKVISTSPGHEAYLGSFLNVLLNIKPAQQLPDQRNRVQSVNLDGSTPSLAIIRPLLINGTQIGYLGISRSEDAIYQAWYGQVQLNITLYLAISSVLLVILYAYITQGVRIRETDAMFLETNARFDTALARGHCGLWDWDVARGRIVWSTSMYHMIGQEPTGNVMGYGDLAKLLHPEDQDMISLANSAFNSDQKQIDHRFRIMHSSGSWVWMRIRAELVRYRGTSPHLIGIAVDISEQEALKQKKRDSDIRLRYAIENISEAFVLWDSKKRLVMCNSKYQQLYNLPASAVTNGSLLKDVMAKSRQPKIRKQIESEKAFANGGQTFEAQLDNGDWLQISERRTQDGGFVSVGTDITQIKRNQEKLVESERMQMATIADLRKTQQELERQAQKLVEFADNLNEEKIRADAANKSKSEFLANISHELRTPLNAIIGFSDIMKTNMFGPLGSEKYDEYAKDIHHSGSFLLGVINDVLDMSKIEAGRFQLQPEPVPVHQLLEETLRIIKIQADKSNIEVGQKIPKSLEIDADRRAVKQILINLLSNAVKFTNEGGKIDVTAKALKTSVNIVIKDNGIGIPPEALEKLGQPFEQVQDQFTKDHRGGGLGLAIARSLAMLHGGHLKITSEVGKGTTVSVRLPYKCEVPEQGSQDESGAENSAAA